MSLMGRGQGWSVNTRPVLEGSRLICEPPAAPGGTAVPGPRPDIAQAPEVRHGIKIRLINWMVYDHRIRD